MASFREEVLADNPTAYGRLEETSGQHLDETANNHDSTTVSVTGQGTADPGAGWAGVGKGNTFDPTNNDFVEYPDSDDWFPGATGAFTIELVVKFAAITTTFQRLVSHESGSDGWNLHIQSAANLRFERKAGGTNTVAEFGNPVTGTVYHVVATYDGSELLLTINGAAQVAVADANSMSNPAVALNLGRRVSDSTRHFDGEIYEWAFYRTALSQTRIQAHYDARDTADSGDATISVPNAAAGTADAKATTPQIALAPSAAATTASAEGPTPQLALAPAASEVTATGEAPALDVSDTIAAIAATGTASAEAGTPSIALAPAEGQATATGEAPGVDVSDTVSPGAAGATASAESPETAIGVAPGAAGATGDAEVPTPELAVAPSAADGTGDAETPTLSGSLTIQPGAAAGTGDAKGPSPSLSLAAPASSATATSTAPGVSLAISPAAAGATGAAPAPAPALTFAAPASSSTAAAQAPEVAFTLAPAAASATATALAPTTASTSVNVTVVPAVVTVTLATPTPQIRLHSYAGDDDSTWSYGGDDDTGYSYAGDDDSTWSYRN